MTRAALAISGVVVQFISDPVLAVPEFSMAAGSFVALTGPSGSGKTTLLHVLAGVLRPTRGVVTWGDRDIARLGEGARDNWRRHNVGLIFQEFHLVEQLSPLQNVLLPATFSSLSVPPEVRARGERLLDELGVPQAARSVNVLSRGERQRVAIARALLFDPPILLADEPTASLDETAATMISDTLSAIASTGRTVVVVSHDPLLTRRAPRLVRIERGRIAEDRGQATEAMPVHSWLPT